MSVSLPGLRPGRAGARKWYAPQAAAWLAAVSAAVAPLLLAVTVPPEHLPGVLLAYLNLLLFAVAMTYFVRSGRLHDLIPVFFLGWLEAAWPLASIYFATQCPGYTYVTSVDERQFLYGNLWLQTITIAFVLSYLSTLLAFRGRHAAWSANAGRLPTDRRVAGVVLVIAVGAITAHAASKVVTFPGVAQYLADGSYLYLHGLMLMVGALFIRLRWHTRLWALLFMGLAAGFYTIGNARGQAALPIALFLAGLVLLSNLQARWKLWIVTAACVLFPLALVIANTTRQLTGTIGFSDLGNRIQALAHWQEVVSTTPVLASTFGRLFFTGGHTIVTMSPAEFPYVHFSASAYLWEFLTRMLPRRAVFESYYSANPNIILMRYDFLITEETSVPVSFVGSLYMLGGVLPVVLGGMVIGVFHSLVSRGLGGLSRHSRYLAVFVFAMIAPSLLWAQNLDPITHVRGVIWAGLSAVIVYQLAIRPLVAEPMRVRRVRRVRLLVPRPI